MKPRITVAIVPGEGGAADTVEILLNETGRAALVDELTRLNERSEHFHMAIGDGGELALSETAYRPEQRIVPHLKVLFRLDEWDRRHFPHLFQAP